jgi:hypothetical protein
MARRPFEVGFGDDEIRVALLDDNLNVGVLVSRRYKELVGERGVTFVVSQNDMDRVGTGRVVAFTGERNGFIRLDAGALLERGAALVMALERFLVLLSPSQPVLAVRRTHHSLRTLSTSRSDAGSAP